MVFNCKSAGSLKIKGEQGIIVTVEGDTISIGIDPETFPEDLMGGANIIVADSVDELPDPTTVPEDTIALVPSDGD
jgi:hypothetical protein